MLLRLIVVIAFFRLTGAAFFWLAFFVGIQSALITRSAGKACCKSTDPRHNDDVVNRFGVSDAVTVMGELLASGFLRTTLQMAALHLKWLA